ncbi:MAG: alkaline shock response membrane anchor protein AmaP [Candidatus Omnitrophota bacterium]
MGVISVLTYFILSFTVGIFLFGLSARWITVVVDIPYFDINITSTQMLTSDINTFFTAAIGALVILIFIRHIQRYAIRMNKEKSITINSTEGKVNITIFAVEDMLRKLLEDQIEMTHIRPKVYVRKKDIEVIIRSSLTQEVSLVEFSQEIQDKIQTKLKVLLGEDRKIKVRIEIRKVAFRNKSDSNEAEPEVPFRNY